MLHMAGNVNPIYVIFSVYSLWADIYIGYFRLKIVEILGNFFRSVTVLTPGDLVQCVYLCLNKLAPAYAGMELGIGETLLMKAVAQATGKILHTTKQLNKA